MEAILLGVHWSNTFSFGTAVVGVVLTLITLGGIIYTVRRKGRLEALEEALGLAHGAAESWEAEWKAVTAKADRLQQELAEEKIRCAKETADVLEEQRELRHDLKDELAAARLEAETWKQKGDQTPVFEGLKAILDRLTSAEESGIATVAEMLERSDERAAVRDAAIIDTQRQIVTQLERLTDRVTEKVGEVVQEKLDQNENPTEGGKT